MNQQLTIVVPVKHDDEALATLLALIEPWHLPIVVVDGASEESTAAIVRDAGSGSGSESESGLDIDATYMPSIASRGHQIAAGIQCASTPWVWVLHADSKPSPVCQEYLRELSRQDIPRWGRFDVELDGLSWIAFFMNWRSRWRKICTGDQAMFFHAQLLSDIGGYPAQPLMEDIEISKRLKKKFPDQFIASSLSVETSSRRWRSRGVLRTVLSMWSFRLRYFFGIPAVALAKQYYGHGP